MTFDFLTQLMYLFKSGVGEFLFIELKRCQWIRIHFTWPAGQGLHCNWVKECLTILTFLEDAEKEPSPLMLLTGEDWKWENIRKKNNG